MAMRVKMKSFNHTQNTILIAIDINSTDSMIKETNQFNQTSDEKMHFAFKSKHYFLLQQQQPLNVQIKLTSWVIFGGKMVLKKGIKDTNTEKSVKKQ